MSAVPSSVLQVLTGSGTSTGMNIISDPRVKKVDITVSYQSNILDESFRTSTGRHQNGT